MIWRNLAFLQWHVPPHAQYTTAPLAITQHFMTQCAHTFTSACCPLETSVAPLEARAAGWREAALWECTRVPGVVTLCVRTTAWGAVAFERLVTGWGTVVLGGLITGCMTGVCSSVSGILRACLHAVNTFSCCPGSKRICVIHMKCTDALTSLSFLWQGRCLTLLHKMNSVLI